MAILKLHGNLNFTPEKYLKQFDNLMLKIYLLWYTQYFVDVIDVYILFLNNINYSYYRTLSYVVLHLYKNKNDQEYLAEKEILLM